MDREGRGEEGTTYLASRTAVMSTMLGSLGPGEAKKSMLPGRARNYGEMFYRWVGLIEERRDLKTCKKYSIVELCTRAKLNASGM